MGKFEGISSNTGDTVWDVNKIGQVGTIFEGIIPNTGDSVRNRDAFQPRAKEGNCSNTGDAVWDRDAGQAVTFIEGLIPDAGDWFPIYRVGYIPISSRRCVTVGDRDRGAVTGVG